MEEWNVFTRKRRSFKEGSGISDESAPSQLLQCTSKELRDTLLKFDAEIATRPIDELTESMRRLAVIPLLQVLWGQNLCKYVKCEMNPSGYLQPEHVEKLCLFR